MIDGDFDLFNNISVNQLIDIQPSSCVIYSRSKNWNLVHHQGARTQHSHTILFSLYAVMLIQHLTQQLPFAKSYFIVKRVVLLIYIFILRFLVARSHNPE